MHLWSLRWKSGQITTRIPCFAFFCDCATLSQISFLNSIITRAPYGGNWCRYHIEWKGGVDFAVHRRVVFTYTDVNSTRSSPYFHVEPLFTIGIGKMYVMVDFICIGLLELRGTRSLPNEIFLPTVRFKPPVFRLQSGHAINYTITFYTNE